MTSSPSIQTSSFSKTIIYSKNPNTEQQFILNSQQMNNEHTDQFQVSYIENSKPIQKTIYGIRSKDPSIWDITETTNKTKVKHYSKPHSEFQHWFQHNQNNHLTPNTLNTLNHHLIQNDPKTPNTINTPLKQLNQSKQLYPSLLDLTTTEQNTIHHSMIQLPNITWKENN